MVAFKRDFDFDYNLMETVAKNVRKYRKENGITQEQLAIDISVSYDFIRRFESSLGREGMSLMTLYKISVVLDTSLDKFVEKIKVGQ